MSKRTFRIERPASVHGGRMRFRLMLARYKRSRRLREAALAMANGGLRPEFAACLEASGQGA